MIAATVTLFLWNSRARPVLLIFVALAKYKTAHSLLRCQLMKTYLNHKNLLTMKMTNLEGNSCHLNLVVTLGANTMCVWLRRVMDSFQGEAAAFLFVGKQSTDQDLKCTVYFQ